MKRFIEGRDRSQRILLPDQLDDYVADSNPVRVVDVFVDELDLAQMGFEGTTPAQTGRPAYHPGVLLKIYIYGHLNRIVIMPIFRIYSGTVFWGRVSLLAGVQRVLRGG